jgi:serine/threonine protein kinase
MPRYINTISNGAVLGTSCAQYRLVSVINSGGHFADIWLAQVRKVYRRNLPVYEGLRVAIKMPKLPKGVNYIDAISPGGWVSQLLKSSFVEEHALRQLDGLECVPKLYDVGTAHVCLGDTFEEPSTVQFLVMELLDGCSLDKYLTSQYAGIGGRFMGVHGADVFFAIAKQIGHGLLKLHRRGVIHGDIWPPNIMMCGGAIRFLDFGQSIDGSLALRGVLQRIGRHPYQAPEGSGCITGDVYSLAGVYCNLATGEDPPCGIVEENELKASILTKIRDVNPRLISENRGVADIIARGLRVDPARRIQTVDHMISDIGLFETASKRPRMSRRSTVRDYLQLAERRHSRDVQRSLARGIFDIVRTDDEISTGMTTLLSFLRPGDSYQTLSTIKFWLPGNVGYDGRFLSMNVVKVVQGIGISRVFLLKRSDIESKEGRAVLLAQLDALNEVCLATKEFGGGPPWFELRYVLLSDEEYTKAVQTYQHGGLIVAGGVGAVVLQTYNAQNRIIASRTYVKKHLFEVQRNAFEKHKRQSLPLTELENLLRIGISAPPGPGTKAA